MKQSMLGRLACWAAVIAGGIGGVGSAHAQDLVFDVNNSAQPFLGFGAQVWAADAVGQSVLTDLNMSFARVQSSVNWFTFPTQPPTDTNDIAGDNFDAMFDYITANFNGPNGSEPWHLPNITSTNNHAQQNGIKLILNEFQIAHSFLNFNNTRMLDSRVDDFATFLAAQVQFLDGRGIRPAFIEMSNEPNGTWNGFISPTQYNTLVQATRAQLDARGFSDIGILGPGLSEIGGTMLWSGNQATDWVTALEPAAVNALAGFSAHAWDDSAGLAGQAQAFTNAIEAVDPGSDKPIFITEFATAVTTFGGVNFGSPNSGGTASEQSPFAVRAFDNALTLLNEGASALLLWEAADQVWNPNGKWGLRRLDGTDRPTFTAMQALLTALPDNATVLAGLGDDGSVNAAAIDGDGRLVIALANTSDLTQQRDLQIPNVAGLTLDSTVMFVSNVAFNIDLTLTGDILTVNLPAQSTLTLIFNHVDLAGDLDGNGFVDILDLNIVLAEWNTDGSGDPRADTDGNGLIDILDLNVVLADWNAGTPPNAGGVVPEPTSLWLLAAGGLSVAGGRGPHGAASRLSPAEVHIPA